MSYVQQTWADGDATKPLSAARMNHIEAGLGFLDRRLIYVDSYGADPTGATDSTAAFVAAQNAGGSNPYRLVLSAGTYLLGTSGSLNTFGAKQGIMGQGMGQTTLTYVGAGTCIDVRNTGTFNNSAVAGTFSDFSIDGSTATTTNARGVSVGDLQAAHFYNVSVANFDGVGQINWYFHNVNGWAEQGRYYGCVASNGTANIVFNNGSFDYAHYDFHVYAAAGQDGVLLQNNAALDGVNFSIKGNFTGGAGNTACVFGVDKGNAATGSSHITGTINIQVEADTGGTGHYTLVMNGGSASQFLGTGCLTFANVGTTFQAFSKTGGQFGYTGRIEGAGFGTFTPGDSLAVHGGTQVAVNGNLSSTLFQGNIYLQAGDIQAFQLASGATTIAFNGDLTRGRKVTFFVKQPASGAAGTLTWPASVAIAPTLSATNNYVDRIDGMYLPSEGKWYLTSTLHVG